MPNLHLLNAEGLSEAIKSADYLAHVMPASILDPDIRTSLDSFHADLQDEAERRIQARQAGSGRSGDDAYPGPGLVNGQVRACPRGLPGTGLLEHA